MKMRYVFLLALCIFFAQAHGQKVLYVHPQGSSGGSGISWQTAMNDLHIALDQAIAGDSVFVAAGVYKPDSGYDRGRYFHLKSGVRLFGGFSGTESMPNERNLDAHLSILSGNIGDQQDSTDNAYTLLVMMYPDSSTLVDGFHFYEGYAYPDTVAPAVSHLMSGAAVYILAEGGVAKPTLRNCVFRNNYARGFGGAVFTLVNSDSETAPVFEHCKFSKNLAYQSGGALYLAYGKNQSESVEISDCHFQDNLARLDGGALYLLNNGLESQMNLLRDTFFANIAFQRGSAFNIDNRRDLARKCNLELDSCIMDANLQQGTFRQTASIIANLDTCVLDIIIRNTTMSNQIDSLGKLLFVYNEFGWNSTLLDRSKILNNRNNGGVFSNNSGLHPDTAIIKGNFFSSIYRSASTQSGRKYSLSSNNIFHRVTFISIGDVENSQHYFSNNLILDGRQYTEYILISGVVRSINIPFIYVRGEGSVFVHNNLFYQNLVGTGTLDTLPNFPFENKIPPICINNIFLDNLDSLGRPALPIGIYRDSVPFVLHNAIDIPCDQLPAYAKCHDGNLHIPDAAQMIDFFNGDYRPISCSKYINKGIGFPGLPGFDRGGGPRIIDGQIDIGPFEAPTFVVDTASLSTPSCESNGTITVQVPQACGPLTYAWQNQAGTTGTQLQGLTPGTYALTATDTLGRSVVFHVEIDSLPALQVSTSLDSVVCGGTIGGAINNQVHNGVRPFLYTWSDTQQNDSLRLDLKVGNYSFTITDAEGCTTVKQVYLPPGGPLTLFVDAEPIPCAGDTIGGSVSAIPFSGKAPFQWLWSTGDTIPALTGIGEGSYTVTITDALNCLGNFTFSLTEPDSIVAFTLVTHNSSLLNPNGSLQVQLVSGGTPGYRFQWENGDTTLFRNQLVSGTYSLTITDTQGCTKEYKYFVDFSSNIQEAPTIGWSLYPNPVVQSEIQFKWDSSGVPVALYRITAVNGALVKAGTLTNSSHLINVRGLASGMYLFTVIDKRGAIVGLPQRFTIAN